METKAEVAEIVFLNDAPWLVTNKRICWEEGVVRLSDVQRVDIVHKRNKNRFPAIGMVFMVVGVVGCFQGLGVLAGPITVIGGLLSIFAGLADSNTTSLIAHCKSGDVVLMEFVWKDPSDNVILMLHTGAKTRLAQFCIAQTDKMNSVREAIGKALSSSSS